MVGVVVIIIVVVVVIDVCTAVIIVAWPNNIKRKNTIPLTFERKERRSARK